MALGGRVVENGKEAEFWRDRWADIECKLDEVAGSRTPETERKRKVAEYVDLNGN